MRAKGFSPDYRTDPRGKSIGYFWAGDAESEAKVEAPNLERLGEIAEFLGQTVSVAQRWQK